MKGIDPCKTRPPSSEPLDGSHSQLDPLTTAVLDYLEYRFPGYPFEPNVDADFIIELKRPGAKFRSGRTERALDVAVVRGDPKHTLSRRPREALRSLSRPS